MKGGCKQKKIMNFSLIHTEKWGNSFGISPSCESIPVLLKALLFRKQRLEISQRKAGAIWYNSDVESKMVDL